MVGSQNEHTDCDVGMFEHRDVGAGSSARLGAIRRCAESVVLRSLSIDVGIVVEQTGRQTQIGGRQAIDEQPELLDVVAKRGGIVRIPSGSGMADDLVQQCGHDDFAD